ncbi:AbrB/MazE/SpoVT family DNA-binding domain-containing protein [Geoalkalibacter halelectricus]|uniref:AbrB/MazE/SpoVT family DNA-binding domain-containing protein n=1 Tax=Geoalkalibacter halelectricus TaxID=2847045 RepID=A0ABY5ZQ97_9BACT|nr:AbrB/MazE/SpoVT family DNA-binding domain-containing protein [Geoalkalibacter halelectricus]MDO3376778.1 AbrB/MazE/SpoVT family DNA-binding domain-containing protein [Geoalkalibacter halelectricus]UWZ81271.1 AbrB/MazE/SpoVT family DNA-binding domain-containing protein [Geoalkalibacter halelectricus]
MALAKLSSKSQIVLPAEICRRLKIKPGDMLEIAEGDNAIVIRKAEKSALEALDACGSKLWQGYDRELEEAREEWNP